MEIIIPNLINSTAEVASSFGINSTGTNVIIGFSFAAMLVGYISILILSLNKKQDNFSKFKIYEKLIISYFIGGIALSFVVVLLAIILPFTAQNQHPEINALGAIFLASFFSSGLLFSFTRHTKTKALNFEVIFNYFASITGLIIYSILIFIEVIILLGPFESWLKIAYTALFLLSSWRLISKLKKEKRKRKK